ncbi:efflux RND transporter periplasmic adaptor subunit, partial [Acinetobacter baumannii]
MSPLANNSEALFQIVDPHNLQFMASVDQFLFGTVLEGQTAEVTIESLPGRSFHARISRVQSLVSSEEK